MPVCEGLPTGICPQRKNDNTVQIGKGDLMLCKSCDTERRRIFQEEQLDKVTRQSAQQAATSAKITCLPTSSKIVSDSSAKTITHKGDSTDRTVSGEAKGTNRSKQQLKTTPAVIDGSSLVTSDALNSTDVIGGASSSLSFGADGGGENCEQLKDGAQLKATEAASSQSVESNTGGKNDLKQIVLNELLSYVSYYRDRANASAIQRVVSSFYSATEITASKKKLSLLFTTELLNCPLLVERRKSTSRSAHDAEIEDILGIFDLLDRTDSLNSMVFAAANFDRIPHYGPEEINICAVVDRQVRTDASIAQLTQAVESLLISQDESFTPPVNQVLEKVAESINVRLSAAVDTQLKRLESFDTQRRNIHQVSQQATRSPQPGASANPEHADRAMNIVVFGVPEDKISSIWHAKLSAALQHVAGRPVDLADAFRIGKFDANQPRPRPIIVKLQCVWDRRLILSNTRKLADASEFRRIGIVPDEPLEIRRKQTLKRLSVKSTRDGKNVSMSADNSALFIDGNLVFSLKDGFVRTGNVGNITNG